MINGDVGTGRYLSRASHLFGIHRLASLLVQDHSEKGLVDFDFAVVLDET
jgi:hypothetical protein